ncbi:MAG: class I tRNA ligase family protein [Chloroflexota bacterium]
MPVQAERSDAPLAYVPADVEERWQEAWRNAAVFATPPPRTSGRNVYIYPAQPFTSGSAHMGHVRSYAIADAYARFHRARGNSVLLAIGFDAFGLPAELSAIARGESPRDWVELCVERMRAQFERLGYSFDWSRSFVTCHEKNYRWTQWLFLTLLEAGMVYRAPTQADWCDNCQTVLPGLQIEDGRCARCDGPVGLIELPQWHLRVAAYADEAADRLDSLTRWSKLALGSQLDAIGTVEGVEVDARDIESGSTLTVFTPHAEAIGAAAFVALSPHDPALAEWMDAPAVEAVLAELRATRRGREERRPEALPVAATGRRVRIEGVDRELPVLVTPAVDLRFGQTAVLGIPRADRTDAALAERMGYEQPAAGASGAVATRPALRRRVSDFVLSRQRAWGSPIPVVHCDACGIVPVPIEELPVRLPEDLAAAGPGRPLAEHPDFPRCECPKCGGPARRDTDTMDCHSDALWVWMAPCVPPEERGAGVFGNRELKRWLPADLVVYGADLGDVLYDLRVGTKALRDAGMLPELPDGEPFDGVLMHEMVRMDGRKMSKHLGNVVDPDRLVADYGADTLRMAALFAAAPARPVSWTEQPLRQCHEFLNRAWSECLRWRPLCLEVPPGAGIETGDPHRDRLERWCSAATRKVTVCIETAEMHRAARDVMFLFDRLVRFEQGVIASRGEMGEADKEALVHGIRLFLTLLAPLAPHIAEELWAQLGGSEMLAASPWPVLDDAAG